jgi:hypothetical protein
VKRSIVALFVLAALAAMTLWGNRLLGRTLDAELAPRLSALLGLPVTLAPISAHLLQLKASSPKLVMGNPQDPAVVATDVEVTLAWDDLWHGEIRLVRVSGTDLMVRPSRWPSSDSPRPNDYRFLDPWLPNMLLLESGRFVSDGGDAYPVDNLAWQRQAEGSATAQWSQSRTAGTVDFNAQVKSLDSLLRLAPVELALDIEVAGKAGSAIAVKASIQPGTTAAYTAQLDIQAAEMSAQVLASGQQAWHFPDQSEINLPLLSIEKLSPLVDSYRSSDTANRPAAGLAATLPSFQLPTHRAQVAISEFRFIDEIRRENTFEITSGDTGLQVSALSSQGAKGVLNGGLGILSNEDGWTVALDMTMQAWDATAGRALQFVGADWLWHTGHARLAGRGKTGAELLNSLTGDVALEGHYHGEVDFPIAVTAQLDNHPEEFALEHLAVALGEGQLSGSARLSGTTRRLLDVELKGTSMDLGFLFPAEDTEPQPGVGVPQFLGEMPDLDLNLSIDLEQLQVPGLNLRQASATLQRNAQGGKLVASAGGANFGKLDLTLEAATPSEEPAQFQLTANFAQLDIADLFRQNGVINSRSTGRLTLHSQGNAMQDIFAAMRGDAKLTTEVRADNNWHRSPSAEEKLALSGNASLVLEGARIVGVKVEKLEVDSIDQDLTGNLTLVTDRKPWLVANLKSEMLNVTGFLALLPSSAQQADQQGLVPSLERLGATRLSLDAKALTVKDVTFSNALIELSSTPNVMTIDQFDFVSQDLTLRTQGKLTWTGDRATLAGTATLTDVELDRFLINSPAVASVPVSGTVQLHSDGRQIEELIRNVTGTIDLSGNAPSSSNSLQSRRKLAVTANRLDDGVQAEISNLQWGESELAASVRYHRTSPPTLEVEIHGGKLTLLPWENAYLSGKRRQPDPTTLSDLDAIARDSADLVETILLSPLRFLGSDEATPPRTRIFTTNLISLDALQAVNMKLTGQLDALVSTEITAEGLKFNSQLRQGRLEAQASSAQLGGGSGELSLSVDSTITPPSFQVSSTFRDVRGIKARATFPRSGFVSLESQGQSQADLAANVNGLIFLDMGRGPFDYANSAFLTANLLTTVFHTLIPGINRQQQQLECGTVLGVFKNGQGNTPYGFAGRTNQANLLGHLSVDLRKEQMEMNIDSRGRQGMGISVGSIFSNTVQIRGPLTNPRIVPNPTGIAWRAWAAVTTGGLSILGESLLRRIWASENPCKSVHRIIMEKECPTNPIAASSPMVCPKT